MLYTGAGDDGMTKMFHPDALGRGPDQWRRGCNQQRISKSSEIPEALGALDELNSFLGFIKIRAVGEPRLPTGKAGIASILREAQGNLFIIQAEIAGTGKNIEERAVKHSEELINEIEKEIPPIKEFSIAGGTELSALLDVARTLARRAERRVIAVEEKKLYALSPQTKAYLNRLSSLLFALARLANHLAGAAEESPHY